MTVIKHKYGYIQLSDSHLYFAKSDKTEEQASLKEAVIAKSSGSSNFLVLLIVLIIAGLNVNHIMEAASSGKILPIILLVVLYGVSMGFYWLYKSFMPRYKIPREKLLRTEQAKAGEAIIHFTDAKGKEVKQKLKITTEAYQELQSVFPN